MSIKFRYLEPPQGRRIAIGDIHACLKTFKSLVEDKIKLTKTDQIILLGDYIDRGPNSSGVIDYIFELQEGGYEIAAIRGNHEQSFVEAKRCGPEFFSNYLLHNHSEDLASAKMDTYLDFFKELPHFLYSDCFYFSHTGFNFLQEKEILEEVLVRSPLLAEQANYQIIHGHHAISLAKIEESIHPDSPRINLDGGCVYGKNEGLGYLCALDIDALTLWKHKNRED